MTPARPEGMTSEHADRLAAMPEDARAAVYERACILHYLAGLPWPEADARAWELHAPGQRTLAGVR